MRGAGCASRVGRGLEESRRGREVTRGGERATRWSEVSGVHDLTSGAPSFRGAPEARSRQDALKITP